MLLTALWGDGAASVLAPKGSNKGARFKTRLDCDPLAPSSLAASVATVEWMKKAG